ncbi:MAG TPA: hypothetical protein VLA78_06105 [Paracoccaceae bacterium]|nr:hypothetical protein [Paracoccaceae bacterium]
MWARLFGAACVVGLSMAVAPADPWADTMFTMPVEALKRAYLDCEQAALDERLASGDAATCSSIYEALKSRAFGGDSEALRFWYQGALRRAIPTG